MKVESTNVSKGFFEIIVDGKVLYYRFFLFFIRRNFLIKEDF